MRLGEKPAASCPLTVPPDCRQNIANLYDLLRSPSIQMWPDNPRMLPRRFQPTQLCVDLQPEPEQPPAPAAPLPPAAAAAAKSK